MRGVLWIPAIALLLGSLQANAQGSPKRSDRCLIYVFMGPKGVPVKTRNYDTVPPGQKHSLLTYRDCKAKIREELSKKLSLMVEEDEDGATEIDRGRSAKVLVMAWARSLVEKVRRRAIWFLLCGLVMFAAGLGLVIAGFRVSVLWGIYTLLAALFLPLLTLVFIVLHWHETKTPFIAYMVAWLAAICLFVF